MRVRTRRTTAGAAVGVLALGALVVGWPTLELRALFPAQRDYVSHPHAEGLSADDLQVASTDGVMLRGWWLHGRGDRALVWFHGNGGNASYDLPNAKRFIDWFGVDVALVDYRGYGHSSGSPTEAGLYADARAIYDAVRLRGFAPEQIAVLGRSLGAAVALDLALDRPCAALALETPFLSFPAVARSHYPVLPRFLFRLRFDNERKIGRLGSVPKLIVQAERDEVVPPAQERRLFDLAAAPKEFYTLAGARHNDTYEARDPGYVAAWQRLLSHVAPEAG